jgi:cellulose synthase/poly-beta-1,6-N-acetylglucosamine synthase-like glycosyltransferase
MLLILNLLLLILLGLSLTVAGLYNAKLRRVSQTASALPQSDAASELPPTALIIPVYNEAENLVDCVIAALNSTAAKTLQVWVVNDQSTDNTWELAETLQQRLADPRLKLLQGQPRPVDAIWVGKNWACTQAAEQVQTQSLAEFLLFIDADVRLNPGAIETGVQAMQQGQIDLLTCAPAVTCGCLAEWLAQPLIMGTILVGFNFEAVNDPSTDSAFAAGPFMLFRQSAYAKIGGHRAVANQVVEDVELSRLIKFSGLNLKFVLGTEIADLRMYQTGAALWEGWTKNLYMGMQRSQRGIAVFVALMLLMCTVPWLGLGIGLSQLWVRASGFTPVILALSLLSIALQYNLRRQLEPISGIGSKYWWLMGLGGLFVSAIAIASVIKTETGWGWTWRGRPLKSST